MHTALEKANSLAENGGGKMSKRKSKNHRKHQQSSQEIGSGTESSGPIAATKVALTTNGTCPDPVKAISKKLEECLHVRENGCTENDLLTATTRAVDQQDDSEPFESGKSSHSDSCKGENGVDVTRNGNVDNSANDRSNKTKINKKLESRESSNGAKEEQFPGGTCVAMNGVHSPSESCPQSSSSSRTEQISNKNECQGLGLEKNVAAASAVPLPVALTETDGSSGQVNGMVVDENAVIEYKEYESELQMQDIMRLIQTELSEPYSIYTYRYFIYNWPKLCFLAAHGDEYVGAIVCKLDMHMNVKRGYIAMLAVKKEYRKMKIGTNLVQKAIEAMLADDADEVVLETEMKNLPALRLYENLGFVRDKRLFRYYLNGVDALRLKLWFR